MTAYWHWTPATIELIVGVVGVLQFEVLQYRLKSEYGADSRLEPSPWTLLRWVEPHPSLEQPGRLIMANNVSLGTDKFEKPVILFPNDWTLRYFMEKNPELKLHELPIEQALVG